MQSNEEGDAFLDASQDPVTETKPTSSTNPINIPETIPHNSHIRPHVVSLNIPRFYKPDPEMFFINIESQFELAGIQDDKSKFTHLTSKLEPEILGEVADVIRNPTLRSYTTLKKAILKRFAQSEEERLNKLLGSMEIGDKNPSQVLRDIQRLAGSDVPETMIRGLWMKKLPTNVQQILQAVSSSPLSQQADVADKVMTVNTPSISAVSIQDPQIEALTQKVNEMSQLLSNLLKSRSRSHTQSSSGHRQSSLGQRSQTPSRRYCHIHYKYREEARRCASPTSCQYLADQGAGKVSASLTK